MPAEPLAALLPSALRSLGLSDLASAVESGRRLNAHERYRLDVAKTVIRIEAQTREAERREHAAT